MRVGQVGWPSPPKKTSGVTKCFEKNHQKKQHLDPGMESKTIPNAANPKVKPPHHLHPPLPPRLLQELYGQLGSALLVALVDGHGTWPSGKPAWFPPRWYWNEDLWALKRWTKQSGKHGKPSNWRLERNRDNCKFPIGYNMRDVIVHESWTANTTYMWSVSTCQYIPNRMNSVNSSNRPTLWLVNLPPPNVPPQNQGFNKAVVNH